MESGMLALVGEQLEVLGVRYVGRRKSLSVGQDCASDRGPFGSV